MASFNNLAVPLPVHEYVGFGDIQSKIYPISETPPTKRNNATPVKTKYFVRLVLMALYSH